MEQLRLCAMTIEPVLQSPGAAITEALCPAAHAPQQEKISQWEAKTPQLESGPCSNKDLHNQKKYY